MNSFFIKYTLVVNIYFVRYILQGYFTLLKTISVEKAKIEKFGEDFARKIDPECIFA